MTKSVSDYLNGIPAKRWRIIALRVENTEDEILESPALTLAIAANEKHRDENNGSDDYPRFLNMGLGGLNDYLGEDVAATVEAAADVDQEADPVGRFPVAEDRAGVAATESAGLSADPDITV